MILPLLSFFAQAPAAPAPGGQFQILFPILLIVMFYFMLIRPQRRQQKEHAARLATLKSGDEVVAAGGIHGLITNVSERTVTLKIADGVRIKIEKSSVVSISKSPEEPEAVNTEVVSS